MNSERRGMKGRASATVLTAALMLAGAGATASAAPSPQHEFTFTPRHESYTSPKADQVKVGPFHAQVKLRGKHPSYYPMPWSFQVTNAKLRSIARGPMKCTATGLNGKYHDHHAAIPVGYIWHSSVGSKNVPQRARKLNTLSGTCTFPVQVGNKPGVAYVGFSFRYKINPSGRAVATTAGPVVNSKIAIRK